MDLPFPKGFVDRSPYSGRHGCGHEGCAEWLDIRGLCWCQHWVVLEYGLFDQTWDRDTWRGKLEAVMPGVSFTFTGAERCFYDTGKRQPYVVYLVHLRVDPLRHRVSEEMLSQLRSIEDKKLGVCCLKVRSFPHCCSMRRRRGKNLENLYMACHEQDEVSSSWSFTRSLFGDDDARVLLKQIWKTVDARIAQIEAEEAEKTEDGKTD